MSRFAKVERVLVPMDVDPDSLMTIGQAAEVLGISVESVSMRAIRGRYTVIEDTEAPLRQGRRLLLRSEVEARASGR